MKISVSIEGKRAVQDIQKEFKDQLSEKQILKTTAFALNETSRRAISFVRKEVRKEYTVNNKYLKRMAKLGKPAKSTPSGLYAEVLYSYKPVPMIAFKFKAQSKKKGSKSNLRNIQVEIRKGKQTLLRHVFIATMKSGHTGIWAHGQYQHGKFVYSRNKTASGKDRMSEMQTASPFTLGTNKDIEKRAIEQIQKTLPSRLRALLQQRVDKLK